MSLFRFLSKFAFLFVVFAHEGLLHAADVLVAGPPQIIAGTKGRFDFLAIDSARRRLLAAHTGNGSLDLIDLDSGKPLKSIAVGAAQDCAVDIKGSRYFVSVSKPPQLAIVDAESLAMTGSVPLDGPADLLAWHASSGLAYVDHDDGKEVWMVDPTEKKVVKTVGLDSDAPEGLVFDPTGKRLFQAMKTASVVSVIDVDTAKVTANWPTAPLKAPHGIALLPEVKAIAIAGGNGQLMLMSQTDGKVLESAEIPQRVDQIAYDAELHRIYCVSGLGKLVILGVENGKLTRLGEIASAEGAHSVVLDPKTHAVWIAYAKGDSSFVQGFSVAK